MGWPLPTLDFPVERLSSWHSACCSKPIRGSSYALCMHIAAAFWCSEPCWLSPACRYSSFADLSCRRSVRECVGMHHIYPLFTVLLHLLSLVPCFGAPILRSLKKSLSREDIKLRVWIPAIFPFLRTGAEMGFWDLESLLVLDAWVPSVISNHYCFILCSFIQQILRT